MFGLLKSNPRRRKPGRPKGSTNKRRTSTSRSATARKTTTRRRTTPKTKVITKYRTRRNPRPKINILGVVMQFVALFSVYNVKSLYMWIFKKDEYDLTIPAWALQIGILGTINFGTKFVLKGYKKDLVNGATLGLLLSIVQTFWKDDDYYTSHKTLNSFVDTKSNLTPTMGSFVKRGMKGIKNVGSGPVAPMSSYIQRKRGMQAAEMVTPSSGNISSMPNYKAFIQQS